MPRDPPVTNATLPFNDSIKCSKLHAASFEPPAGLANPATGSLLLEARGRMFRISRMRSIAVIGAGELGGAIAHAVARHDTAIAVRIVDDSGRIAEGKALDIAQASPVEGFSTDVTGSTDMMSVGGAEVVIVADRAVGGEWQGEEGLLLLKRLQGIVPSAVIICAGAQQRDIIDRGVGELRIHRQRVFGSAPEALASGARALVALAAGMSPGDVALTIVGNPPAHTIVPWEDAAAGGF